MTDTPKTTAPAETQISIRMPVALLERIDAAARGLGINRAGFMRMAAIKALQDNTKGEQQ